MDEKELLLSLCTADAAQFIPKEPPTWNDNLHMLSFPVEVTLFPHVYSWNFDDLTLRPACFTNLTLQELQQIINIYHRFAI